MKSMNVARFGIIVAAIMLVKLSAFADITWSGRYRVEGTLLNNARLDDTKSEKSYINHHLVLMPKIVASDGVTIFGRLGLMNSSAYPDSQIGQFLGQAPGGSTTATTCASGVPAYQCSGNQNQTQSMDTLAVQQLYLNWTTDYGIFIAGRAPIHFGLGMSYNAGDGAFDHWLDTKDMVGYQFLVGNLTVIPMYGKVREGTLDKEDDINDYMLQVQYDNPDTNLALGVFYQQRVSTKFSQDNPRNATGAYGGAGPGTTDPEGMGMRDLNIFVAKKYEEFELGFEAGFANGNVGLQTAQRKDISVDSYGLAGEFTWKPNDSRFQVNLKAGMISGDNPDTDERFEGYLFDRNYDVAFLLFNHPLGGQSYGGGANPSVYDALGGRAFTGGSVDKADVEAMTNAIYLSPAINWRWGEKWTFTPRWTWASLVQTQLANRDIQKALGNELDFTWTYKPHDRLTFATDVGLFFPGEAFAGGTLNLRKDFMYGIATKAAFSF